MKILRQRFPGHAYKKELFGVVGDLNDEGIGPAEMGLQLPFVLPARSDLGYEAGAELPTRKS